MSNIIQNGNRIETENGDLYRIIQHLGIGGNSQVYLAMSTRGVYQGVLFAIKFFMKVEDEDRLEKFRAEASFLSDISHPAIMKIFSRGDYYLQTRKIKVPFVVCEYFPDRLDYRLRGQKLRLTEKLIYILQLLSALQFLESKQVVHRDIKPANIFLKGYSCCLGDFGLMKKLDDVEDVTDMFKHSDGPGMPKFYRTPDLVKYAKGEESLSCSSDIFQLGLVAAEMFTGRNPLKKSDNKLSEISLEDLNNVAGQSGLLIKDLIEKMLVIEPGNRGKLNELLDGFDGVLREATTKQIELDDFAF